MKATDILSRIYDQEDAIAASEGIEQLTAKYRSQIDATDYPLSEKDVVLICYGDQVHQTGERPLVTLKRFFDRFLADTINTVHILPFYPYSSDDGFSVIDYQAVDSGLGTWEDIANLARDYRIMFDAVINHISKESEWFKGYLADDPQYADFFIDVDPTQDLSQVVRPRALPLLTPFKAKDGTERHVWTTFSDDQIDLNYANYKLLLEILEVLLFYISQGAGLLRLDAIGFAWKEIGTPCIHHPKTHLLIKLMRSVLCELSPGTTIVTETNVPHQENISYFGDGTDEAQMVYNFALPPLLAHGILTGNAEVLTSWAGTLELPSQDTCFFNFAASHDGVGVRPAEGLLSAEQVDFLVQTAEAHGGHVSYKNNLDGTQSPYELNCNYRDLLTAPDETDEWRIKRLVLSQAVVLAMPGVPGLYFHSLVGSGNYHDGVKQTGRYRSINREKLDFGELSEQLQDQDSLHAQVLSQINHLLSIRRKEPAFNPFGDFKIHQLHAAVFAVERIPFAGGESLLALFNLSGRSVSVEVAGSFPKTDLITSSRFPSGSVWMEPYEAVWLK